MIHVESTERDNWLLEFCAEGQGNTESEALAQLQPSMMERHGSTVSVNGSSSHLMRSSLRVEAPATGKVDAAGFVVDFAGSEGTVRLSSESSINGKLRATSFRGSRMACYFPPLSQSPFVVIVNGPHKKVVIYNEA